MVTSWQISLDDEDVDDLEALWEDEANEPGEDLAATVEADEKMSQDEPEPDFDDDSNAISLDAIKKKHPLDEDMPKARVIPPPEDEIEKDCVEKMYRGWCL